jgi:hypothetical protein
VDALHLGQLLISATLTIHGRRPVMAKQKGAATRSARLWHELLIVAREKTGTSGSLDLKSLREAEQEDSGQIDRRHCDTR